MGFSVGSGSLERGSGRSFVCFRQIEGFARPRVDRIGTAAELCLNTLLIL